MILDDGNIKIIDFGVALLEGARRVTWRGLSGTVGTPDNMSPEQLRGERGTASSDIYSVGAMLFEMLSGHVPFEGENVFAILNQHVIQDPPSILQINPNISPALATVVMRSIRRDPEKRYHSMKDMHHDLLHLDEVIPVHYTPETSGFGKRYQRVTVLTLVLITISLSIIALGILAQLAHHSIR